MSDWGNELNILAKSFPLTGPGEAEPEMARAIDTGVKDMLLEAIKDIASAANPFYVEELLQDCVTRVSNCLVLREKAQDVEERAVFAAESYTVLKATLSTQSATATLLDAISKNGSQNATSATYQAGAVTFTNDVDWPTVVKNRQTLEKALNDRNERSKEKSGAPGNAANYGERFAFLKKLFDLSLKEAFKRAHVAARALKEIYAIDIPVPDVIPIGFLDTLTVWAQTASDALDRELDNRYIGRVAFTIASPDETLNPTTIFKKSEFAAKIPTNLLDFSLTSDPFEKCGMKDVRLRSIKVLIDGKDQARTRLWNVQVKLPDTTLTVRTERFSTIATSSFSDAGDTEAIVKGVHNIDPRGSWEVRLGSRAITGEPTSAAEISNLYIVLVVSYRRL